LRIFLLNKNQEDESPQGVFLSLKREAANPGKWKADVWTLSSWEWNICERD